MIRVFLLGLSALSLSANVAVTGDTYKKISDDATEVIYASEYDDLSQRVLDYESGIIKSYSDSYGYELDDTQYVGLLSSHNQIANAYSTQIPLNLQMNFPAGALSVDYFASRSWIRMLLLHESSHNFQLNPKKNMLSYYAHKVVKNSFFTTLLFIPIFPVPNFAESSFMLEGNAVLNESRHNNGGRLYNGSLLAMAVTQARAGYITPERTYNDHLYFPYGAHHYIVGGFFHLYLSQKYGIDKVNSYFYNFSGQWIPVFTNAVFEETFGEDFETALKGYNSWLLKTYDGFQESQGEVIAHSQNAVALNSDDKEIFFITSNRREAPNLVRYDKQSTAMSATKTAHPIGKVFKKNAQYYTLSSAHTDVDRIEVGLYDAVGDILKESSSKAIQSIDDAGEMVYIDIPSSFDMPQMYVDGAFYARANSTVFSKNGQHYYFVQEDKTRTLYRDKEALFSFQGWYGFVCDKDENGIYFIANSAYGSTLYRYHDKQITRMTQADDIIDARLLPGGKALVETMAADGIEFKEIVLEESPAHVEEVRYFFEEDARFKSFSFENHGHEDEPYMPFFNLHYASLTQSLTTSGDGVDFNIAANFMDPLSQNALRVFSSKVDEDVIAGVGYSSSAYRLGFGASVFAVLDHDEEESSRDFGTQLYVNYPLLHTTYEKMDVKLSYLLEGERDEKEPLTLGLNYQNQKQFGHSMYPNSANNLELAVGLDRDDRSAGVKYHFSQGIAEEFYLGVDMRVGWSDVDAVGEKRGIKITQNHNIFSDALNFEMPSLNSDIYVKEIRNAELSLTKVFNFDSYYFSFPISLRREAIYGKYNYYDLKFLSGSERDFHEMTLGLTADLLYFNSLALPLSVEYIHNDGLEDANNFRVLFDLRF